MHIIKYLLIILALIGITFSFPKIKLVAFKKHNAGFIGLKVRKPKLLGHGLAGLGGFGHGFRYRGKLHWLGK